ncbi:MAG: hypothetical protein DMF06_17020, partial [Verrucomicrobia bacterium]
TTFVYNGAANQVAGNGLPATVTNLTIANSGAGGSNTVTGNAGQTVTGLMRVQQGIYSAASTYKDVQIDSGAAYSATGTVSVSGNWTNNGTFTANSNGVTFNGTNQAISGQTTFYNLTKTTAAANTLTFEATKTQSVTNALTLTGAAGNLLSLRSSVNGTTWKINAPSTQSVSFCDVKDSDASGGQPISSPTSTNSLNNTNWSFAAPAPVMTTTPASLSFGNQSVGTSSSTQDVTINNTTGTAALNWSAALSGADAAQFTIVGASGGSIPAGGSGTVSVRFSPASIGTKTTNLVVSGNDGANPSDTIGLTGTGVAPEVNVTGNGQSIADGDSTPSLADHTAFGLTPVTGGTVVRTFTIENIGNGSLILSGTPIVAIGGTNAADFSVTTQPTSPLGSGDSTTFQVTFNPSARGVRTATISIDNNDSDENPYNFSIQGTGTYTLSFNGNGNTGGTAPGAVDFDSLAGVLGPGTLVRNGFQFVGWNTAANGSGTEYFPGQSFIIGADTTLFAQWAALVCDPGGLDPTFGTNGKVTTDIQGDFDKARGVAIQADGKIVVAGSALNGANIDFAVLRYNTNGTLDTSFDGDGKAITPVLSSDDLALAVAIQPDGKIVAAGFAINVGTDDFAVVRYNTDGSLDPTFDSDGKATFNIVPTFNDIATAVAIQPDGKIVVAGFSNNGSDEDFTVIRLTDVGALDPTFNAIGITTFPIQSNNDAANAVAIQSDGKIVVAGYTETGSQKDFGVARLTSTGVLDPSFDFDGKVASSIKVGDDIANSVAIQPDGKIVAAGLARDSGPDTDFAAIRYNSDGTLDDSFDTDGRVIATVASPNDVGRSVALQPDGKIVIAGETNNGSNLDFGVVRLNTNGSLDLSFDLDGKAIIDFQNSSDTAYSAAVQADGRIVVVGDSDVLTTHDIGLVRLGGPCAPEINVQGNSVNILDGNAVPTLAD